MFLLVIHKTSGNCSRVIDVLEIVYAILVTDATCMGEFIKCIPFKFRNKSISVVWSLNSRQRSESRTAK